MKWWLWGGEVNKLLLISETLAGSITLQGAEGYNNAVKILCIHNHPTGIVIPSVEDNKTTIRLKDVGNIVGIPLIDHIIIGTQSYYSYLENGVLEWSKF